MQLQSTDISTLRKVQADISVQLREWTDRIEREVRSGNHDTYHLRKDAERFMDASDVIDELIAAIEVSELTTA